MFWKIDNVILTYLLILERDSILNVGIKSLDRFLELKVWIYVWLIMFIQNELEYYIYIYLVIANVPEN